MSIIRISETDFSSQVEDLLYLYGWRWTHFRPAWSAKGYRTPITGDKGFPDYCAVRPPRLLFIELKDKYSKLSPEQEDWHKDLRECEQEQEMCSAECDSRFLLEVYLWRPKDIDLIMEILK